MDELTRFLEDYILEWVWNARAETLLRDRESRSNRGPDFSGVAVTVVMVWRNSLLISCVLGLM